MTMGGPAMLMTRRAFAACALCAAGDFLATSAEAQTAGFKLSLIHI